MTQTPDMLTLGQQLRAGRLALDLTIDQVAQQTNLKRNHIESLEDDIFILPNVPPAFVRGYVRNYVRFLRLPETLIGTANYGEVTIPQANTPKVAPLKVKNNRAQIRWVKSLTWLILLGVVGMTVAWWWQEHQKDQASRDQIVNTNHTAQSAENPATQAITLNTTPAPAEQSVAEPVVVNQAQPIALNTTTDNNLTPPSTDVATQNNTVSQPAVEQQIAITLPEAQPTTTEPTPAPQTPAVTAQETTTETQVSPEPTESAVSNDELRIEISGHQSWITVRNGKKKRLAEKLYNAGDVLTFNNHEQYSLTIGAPANVKIYYKGQLVPLKVDGRVARFKLPLAN